MKNYQLTDWQDYWKIFDELIEQLTSENKIEIVAEFEEAQKYVNGLTDGWYEFKFALEKSINSNKQNMTEEQYQIAEFLLTTLNKSLINR
jgi:hypothetical protein